MSAQSETIGELAKALVKVQATMKAAVKNKVNPFYKSSYADLESCLAAARSELSENGLCVSQTTDVTELGTLLVTTLLHVSGEWISGNYPIVGKDNSPQSIGAAITYARRYAFCAIVGLATEDDDGNAAQGVDTSEAPLRSNWHPSEPQLKRLYAISKKNSWTDEDCKEYMAKLGVSNSKELTYLQYEKFCEVMEKFPKTGGLQ